MTDSITPYKPPETDIKKDWTRPAMAGVATLALVGLVPWGTRRARLLSSPLAAGAVGALAYSRIPSTQAAPVEPVKLDEVPSEGEHAAMSMLLTATGDAMGYRRGTWEFNKDTANLQRQVRELGGIPNLSMEDQIVSDDTMMTLMVMEALIAAPDSVKDFRTQCAERFLHILDDQAPRGYGITTMNRLQMMRGAADREAFLEAIPFDAKGGGCGGAMRSMPIGLVFHGEDNREKLIAYALNSAIITHHHPTGAYGAVASALFVALAQEGVGISWWCDELMELRPRIESHIRTAPEFANSKDQYLADTYFWDQWQKYADLRPDEYTDTDVMSLYEDWKTFAWDQKNPWPGASGHDAPMIAYDALRAAHFEGECTWEQACLRGVIHGGDSDSTGAIMGAIYGAMYGKKYIPEAHLAMEPWIARRVLETAQKLPNPSD